MDTNTAQPFQYQPVQPVQPVDPVQTPPVSDSYADAYVPPAAENQTSTDQSGATQSDVIQPADDQPSAYQPSEVQPTGETAAEASPVVAAESTSETTPSEELADQNIFEMLGVTTGTPEQREQFLDELQQVIWEDFIEHDTKLLLTDAEQADLAKIMQATTDKSLEQQEQVVVFLEKLIPDLEDIMLEKALQLKEEMARERLNALRELHRNDDQKFTSVQRAEELMSQQQWRTASEILNGLT